MQAALFAITAVRGVGWNQSPLIRGSWTSAGCNVVGHEGNGMIGMVANVREASLRIHVSLTLTSSKYFPHCCHGVCIKVETYHDSSI